MAINFMKSEVQDVARPLKYKTAEEMQTKIDEYFESLMRPLLIWDKKLNANIALKNPETDELYFEQYKPATITGLALALNLTRKGLLDYSVKNKAFCDTITRAKQRIEEYAETRLYDRDGAKGAEFNLKCNFGWVSNQQELDLKQKELELKQKGIEKVNTETNKLDAILKKLNED